MKPCRLHSAFCVALFTLFVCLPTGFALTDSREPPEWYARAKADFEVADLVHEQKTDPPTVCFHVHQGVEKFLKGRLMEHGVTPEQNHHLVGFIKALRKKEPELQEFLDQANRLDRLYISSRYPQADLPAIGELDAEACNEYAREFLDWVGEDFPQYALL